MTEPPQTAAEQTVALDLSRCLASSAVLFRSVTTTIQDMLELARADDTGILPEILKKLAELETLLGRALAMEAKLHELRSKTQAGPRAGEIDFDAVRDQIRGRLDQLRRASGAG